MAIKPDDIEGVDEDLARRVIVHARSIAPCLDSLSGDARQNAIAILKGVAADAPAAGHGRLKSLSRNGTSMTFDLGSVFTADVRTSLKSLCAATSRGGLPVGSFPEARPLAKVWPEGEYS